MKYINVVVYYVLTRSPIYTTKGSWSRGQFSVDTNLCKIRSPWIFCCKSTFKFEALDNAIEHVLLGSSQQLICRTTKKLCRAGLGQFYGRRDQATLSEEVLTTYLVSPQPLHFHQDWASMTQSCNCCLHSAASFCLGVPAAAGRLHPEGQFHLSGERPHVDDYWTKDIQ